MTELERLQFEEKKKSIERGKVFFALKQSEYWNDLLKVYDLLLEEWDHENRVVRLENSMEFIAHSKLRSAYSIKGLQDFFRQIEDDVQTFKEQIDDDVQMSKEQIEGE